MKLQNVVDWFNDAGCPFYQIVANRTSKIYWNDEETDIETAAEKLSDHLQKLPAGAFTINVFKTAKSTSPYGSYKFKVEPEYAERAQYSGGGVPTLMLLDEIRSLKSEVSSLKNEIELSNEIADNEPESEPEGLTIGGLIAKPEIQSVLIGLLTKLFQPAQPAAPVAIAGVLDDINEDTMSAAMVPVKILLSKGVTVNDLAILANKSDKQLKTLLNMLRNGF